MQRVNGASSAQQSLAGSLQYYVVFASSPLAFTDPNPNPAENEEITRQINIGVTNEIRDQSQKNFEILFQSVGLRAVPTIMSNPVVVEDLSSATVGAPTLTGEGFVWKFAVERADTFMDYTTNDPVGLLISELDGVIIDSAVRITTKDGSPSGVSKNIEFTRVENL